MSLALIEPNQVALHLNSNTTSDHALQVENIINNVHKTNQWEVIVDPVPTKSPISLLICKLKTLNNVRLNEESSLPKILQLSEEKTYILSFLQPLHNGLEFLQRSVQRVH